MQAFDVWAVEPQTLQGQWVRTTSVDVPMGTLTPGDDAFTDIGADVPENVDPDVSAAPRWIIVDKGMERRRIARLVVQKQTSITLEPRRYSSQTMVVCCCVN